MRDVQKHFREYVKLDRRRRVRDLTPRELERWHDLKRTLNDTFSPPERPEHEDKRESVRVPVRLVVRFHSRGELQRCLLTNLSRGGVFVNTSSPSPIGTRLLLRIVVDGDTEIEVNGEVVSHNVGPNFTTHQVGMGVRFVDLSTRAKRGIDQVYEGALDLELDPA